MGEWRLKLKGSFQIILAPLTEREIRKAAYYQLGPVDKLDSQSLRDVIQDSFCGGYLGAVADGGCRVGIL